VFANSLQLKQPKAGHCSGTCSLTCGTPIMRALNPDYCGDLIIHFVPRPGFTNNDGFIINTKCQGNVYHTINCFDEELEGGDWTGRVVVDAFVSKLNAERESAQFELDPEELVYDNEGEPFRFVVDSPAVPNKRSPCRFQAIASDVDSTIDFHCINPKFNGRRHQYSYMVSHTRHRDDKGCVLWVESRLIKIAVKYTGVDPLAYDPDTTRQYVRASPSWQDPNAPKPLSCYLRTPLFVSRADAKEEDDGHLFCWSFDTEPSSTDKDGLRAYVLMFDARNMECIMRVAMPDGVVIPYTVHSNIYSRTVEQQQAEQQHAEHAEVQWDKSTTVLPAAK
jgi:carotenoid cleavage dioxygenase-like enzyme